MRKKWLRQALSVAVVSAMLAGMPAMPLFAAEEAAVTEVAAAEEETTEQTEQSWEDFGLFETADGGVIEDGRSMTFGEFASVFSKLMGYTELAENNFKDVPEGSSYEDGILKLKAAGLLSANRYIRPDEAVTRMQVFEIIVKAFEFPKKSGKTNFEDDRSFSIVQRSYIKALELAGVLTGGDANPKGTVDPQSLTDIFKNLTAVPLSASGEYTNDFNGNVIVSGSGISLSGMKIDGNLYIIGGIDAVDLENVEVSGTIFVLGADAVNLSGVTANKITLNNEDVKVNVSDKTSFKEVDIRKSATIANASEKYKIADKIVVGRGAANVSVTLENISAATLVNNNKGALISGNATFDAVGGTDATGNGSTYVITEKPAASYPPNSDPTPSEPSVVTPAKPVNEKKLNVYYINWAAEQTVLDLPWERLSTVNHSFWRIVPNASHTEFPIASTDPVRDPVHFAHYEEMLAKYPDVNVVLSVGGWNDTKWFAEMASTETGRQSFIDSCVETLDTYDFLGGIDIDWEYPGTSRNAEGEGFIGSEADKDNFTALIKGMRDAFDASGHEDAIITFCASTNVTTQKAGVIAVDYAALAPYVDRINIMTYDMAWSGSNKGVHQTALYPGAYMDSADGTGISASEAAEYVISLGVDPGKINIGSPLYSHGWVIPSAVTSGTPEEIAAGALGQPATGPAFQQMMWHDLKAMENTEGWVAGYDKASEAAYLYNTDKDSPLYQYYLTYESERSLDAKINYINKMNLGGLIVWDTTGDSDNFAMLSRMSKGLGITDEAVPEFNPDPYTPPAWMTEKATVRYWNFGPDVFSPGSFVIYNGSVFVAKAETHSGGGGEEPGRGWGYWEGEGTDATGGTPIGLEKDLLSLDRVEIPVWNDGKDLPEGSIVSYNSALYISIAKTAAGAGQNPENTSFWKPYDPTDASVPYANAVGGWNNAVVWRPGDLTIHKGFVWKNIKETVVSSGIQEPSETNDSWEQICAETDLFSNATVPAYDDATVWNRHAIVKFGDKYYRNNRTVFPGDNIPPSEQSITDEIWAVYDNNPPATPKANSLGFWDASLQWYKDSYTIHNGSIYKAWAGDDENSINLAEEPGVSNQGFWGSWNSNDDHADVSVGTTADLFGSLANIVPEFDRTAVYQNGAVISLKGKIYRQVAGKPTSDNDWTESPEDSWATGWWEEILPSDSQTLTAVAVDGVITEEITVDELTDSEETEDAVGDEAADTVEDETAEAVEDEAADTVEDETVDTVEDKTEDTVEDETADAVEDETVDTVEDETAEAVENEAVDTVTDETVDTVAEEAA